MKMMARIQSHQPVLRYLQIVFLSGTRVYISSYIVLPQLMTFFSSIGCKIDLESRTGKYAPLILKNNAILYPEGSTTLSIGNI